MPHFEKHFTPDEANALVPELAELLTAVRSLRDQLVVDWEQARPVLRATPHNGGGMEANPFLQDICQLNRRVHRLVELGVLLKDVDRGLVDFPAWRDEREVFLCWHLGEERVAFWHELDSGFAGRQPL